MLRIFSSCCIFFVLTACGGSDEQPDPDTTMTSPVADLVPDPFELGGVLSAEPHTFAESDSVMLSGFNTATDITIEGGEYAINNGDFTSVAGTLLPTQTITVRVNAPSMLGQSHPITLTVGGVSDSLEVMSADLTPPTIQMMYPAVNSLTDQPTIPLRVSAVDTLSDVVSVTATNQNNQAFDVMQNEGEWWLDADLDVGMNTITLAATDSAGNTAQVPVYVQREMILTRVQDIVHDSQNNRVFYIDTQAGLLLSMDVGTEAVTVVSDLNTWPELTESAVPMAVGASVSNRIVYVFEYTSSALWTVDTTTGEYEKVYNVGDEFSDKNWTDMVLNADATLAYLLHNNGVVKVDLTSGQAQSILQTDNANNGVFDTYFNIELSHALQKLYISSFSYGSVPGESESSFNGRIYELDTAGNNVKTLSPYKTVGDAPLLFARGFAVDDTNDRLLLNGFAYGHDIIQGIDINTGERSLVYKNTGLPDDIPRYIQAMALDAETQQLYAVSSYSGDITTVTLSNSSAQRFGQQQVGLGPDLVVGQFMTEKDDHVFLFDDFFQSLIRVNTLTGERVLLWQNYEGSALEKMDAVHFDLGANRILATAKKPNTDDVSQLLAFDFSSGERTVLVDTINANIGDSMAYNAADQIVYVDVLAGSDKAGIMAIHIATQALTPFIQFGQGGFDSENVHTQDIVFNDNVYLMVNNYVDDDIVFYKIDATGQFVEKIANISASGEYAFQSRILDVKDGFLTYIDKTSNEIYGVNTSNGAINLVFELDSTHTNLTLAFSADNIINDEEKNRYLYVSDAPGALLAVDKYTSQVAIISK